MSVVLVKLLEAYLGGTACLLALGSSVHGCGNTKVLNIAGRLVDEVVVALGNGIELGSNLCVCSLEVADGCHLLLDGALGSILGITQCSVECINILVAVVAGSIAALNVLILILCDKITELAGNSLLGCLNLIVTYTAEEPHVHAELLCLGRRAPDVESAAYTLLGTVVAIGESVNIGIAVELEGKLTCHACGLKYLGGSGLGRSGDGSAV